MLNTLCRRAYYTAWESKMRHCSLLLSVSRLRDHQKVFNEEYTLLLSYIYKRGAIVLSVYCSAGLLFCRPIVVEFFKLFGFIVHYYFVILVFVAAFRNKFRSFVEEVGVVGFDDVKFFCKAEVASFGFVIVGAC